MRKVNKFYIVQLCQVEKSITLKLSNYAKLQMNKIFNLTLINQQITLKCASLGVAPHLCKQQLN